MKCANILILFVSPLLTSALSPGFKIPAHKLFQPKVSIICKMIHCPAVERPICVKFKHKEGELSKKDIYMYMVNKCELQYIKCHQGDVEATVVPMKNCIHGKKSNSESGPVKKRPKRHVGLGDLSLVNHARRIRSVALNEHTDDATYSKHNESRKSSSKRHKKHNHRNKHGRRKHKKKNNKKKNKRKSRSHHRRNEISTEQKQAVIQNDITANNKTSVNDTATTKLQANSTALKALKTGKSISNQTKVLTINNTVASRRDDYKFFKEKFFNKYLKGASKDFADSSDFSAQAEKEKIRLNQKKTANKGENDRDCPTVCPARAVMVCAQCQHGVYRTFISVCHMRMFVCNNQDEKLHLVSRYPCVLSAPFLSSNKDMNMEPQGHVTEPNDHDGVLRFIYCREANEFGSKKVVDPRCNQFKSYSNNQKEKLVGATYFDMTDQSEII